MRSVSDTDSPVASLAGRRRCVPGEASFVLACLILAAFGVGVAFGDGPLVTRLRVTIDSPTPTPLNGELSVTAGTLERLRPLSLSPAGAAGSSLDEGRVLLRHQTATSREAFDVTVRSAPGESLTLQLGDAVASVPLDSARDATATAPLTVAIGEQGAAITVTRPQADRVRIESPRDSFLFVPGESFSFGAFADPAGVAAGETVELVATLARGRTGAEVWRSEPQRVDTDANGVAHVAFEAPLPNEEGVYRLTLTATKPASFRSRFLPGSQLLHTAEQPLAQRSVQLAVFDAKRRPPTPGDWQEAFAFDPRSHGWADRLPERMRWRRLPWFASEPRSSQDGADTPRDGAIEIEPSPGDGRVHWRAYPLSVDQPGATYAIEVETLGEPGDAVTIAVLEPDALGDLRPVSSVVTHLTPRWNRDGERPFPRLLVRPRTNSPLLVLCNPSETRPARFGRVRLLKSQGVATPGAAAERVVALDWIDADLPHAVGASHVRSELGAFEHPDLVTYWETASALADRVEAAGANAAAIPVNQSGGALYDSRLWASPRYDLGMWSDGVSDTPRRELLKLIAKEFRRRGLQITPVLRFDAPTAAIDRRSGSYRAGGEAAVVARRLAVEEVLDAVGDPGVLAGVAIRATPDGWSLRDPAETPPDADARSLVNAYEELARVVTTRLGRPTQLTLLPADLTRRADLARAFNPRLGAASGAGAEVLRSLGLAALSQDSDPAIVAAPYGAAWGHRSGDLATTPLTLAALRRSLPPSASPQAATSVRSLRADRQPIQLIQSGKRLRNASGGGDVLLPAVSADPLAESTLLAGSTQEGVATALVDGLAASGWIDEEASRRRRLFTMLPMPTEPIADAAESDTARDITANATDLDSESLVLVVNQTAWPRRARVTLQTPQRLRGLPIDPAPAADGAAAAGQWFDAGRHVLDLQLGPQETVAWRFSASGVRVEGVRIDPQTDALRELAEALAELQGRDTTRRRAYDRLINPSFEVADTAAETALVGWRPGEGVRVDTTTAVDGAASVLLTAAENRPATLTSDPFPAPDTGQLVLGLRVLPGSLADGSELRIDIEQIDGAYRSRATLGAEQLSRPSDSADGWLPPIVFPIDDLPVRRTGDLRLRFTLVGDGVIHLDDLRPEDLVLPLDGYGGIDLRTERFAIVRLLQTSQTLLDEGRLEACRELLESYWARFLIDNFPARDAKSTIAQEAAPGTKPAPSEPSEEPAPSVSERLRGYLPRWWR
ncbi:hypothetical protein Pla108_37960 [Botrimarina colliarenosi]|uniref:Glycosyl hydrolase-like 10 domain-containing protein n=1 Tax=Botrimarina colliarenosi TaxID=2528001 RepID=A0A5C6A2H5_9BACT|nr:hypothetical protein [Botrimarina colliarenosi]TWT94084.1 hypothetical protein Pla108_37960 [Botrimarina colliarenosi]